MQYVTTTLAPVISAFVAPSVTKLSSPTVAELPTLVSTPAYVPVPQEKIVTVDPVKIANEPVQDTEAPQLYGLGDHDAVAQEPVLGYQTAYEPIPVQAYESKPEPVLVYKATPQLTYAPAPALEPAKMLCSPLMADTELEEAPMPMYSLFPRTVTKESVVDDYEIPLIATAVAYEPEPQPYATRAPAPHSKTTAVDQGAFEPVFIDSAPCREACIAEGYTGAQFLDGECTCVGEDYQGEDGDDRMGDEPASIPWGKVALVGGAIVAAALLLGRRR